MSSQTDKPSKLRPGSGQMVKSLLLDNIDASVPSVSVYTPSLTVFCFFYLITLVSVWICGDKHPQQGFFINSVQNHIPNCLHFKKQMKCTFEFFMNLRRHLASTGSSH